MAKHTFTIGEPVEIHGMQLEVAKIKPNRLSLRPRRGDGFGSMEGLATTEQRAYLRGFLDHEEQLRKAPTGAALNVMIAREKLGLDKEDGLVGGALVQLATISKLHGEALKALGGDEKKLMQLTVILRSIRDGGALLDQFQAFMDHSAEKWESEKELREEDKKAMDDLKEEWKKEKDDAEDNL